ncbi:MAG: ABC-three component system middle component 8 [Gemmatimonadaceae bacterium]
MATSEVKSDLLSLCCITCIGTAILEPAMLRPNKHSDPSLTVVPVAANALQLVRSQRIVSLTDLRLRLNNTRAEVDPLIVPALHTLFLLGLIAYRRKADAIEYVGP